MMNERKGESSRMKIYEDAKMIISDEGDGYLAARVLSLIHMHDSCLENAAQAALISSESQSSWFRERGLDWHKGKKMAERLCDFYLSIFPEKARVDPNEALNLMRMSVRGSVSETVGEKVVCFLESRRAIAPAFMSLSRFMSGSHEKKGDWQKDLCLTQNGAAKRIKMARRILERVSDFTREESLRLCSSELQNAKRWPKEAAELLSLMELAGLDLEAESASKKRERRL